MNTIIQRRRLNNAFLLMKAPIMRKIKARKAPYQNIVSVDVHRFQIGEL